MTAQEEHDEEVLSRPLKLHPNAAELLKVMLVEKGAHEAAMREQPRSAPEVLTPAEWARVRASVEACRDAPQGLLDAIGF